jgi:hypothetical protein
MVVSKYLKFVDALHAGKLRFLAKQLPETDSKGRFTWARTHIRYGTDARGVWVGIRLCEHKCAGGRNRVRVRGDEYVTNVGTADERRCRDGPACARDA